MELASKHVKVTLDGQGADEHLAGYHYFFGSYYLELIREFKILKFLRENYFYLAHHKKFDALKYFLFYSIPERYQNQINRNRYPSVKKQFIDTYENSSNLNSDLYKPKNLNDSLLSHFKYKLEHLLRYEDLNSMHFSIESRVPFLDHRLVERVLSSSSAVKIQKGETKHILRESIGDLLPEKIKTRKDKKGFSNPRANWFRSEDFQSFIKTLINSDEFKQRGYFCSKTANEQYTKHLEKKIDASKEIWKWINLELWFRKYID
jgi:asparagine synthase (glutamine-hydrolysing)